MWAIIGAIPQEVQFLKEKLDLKFEKTVAGKFFFKGSYHQQSLVVTESGIGKVNAAMTSQIIADYFPVKKMILAGTAGGLSDKVNIGDIVLARELLQYDVSRAGRELAGEKSESWFIYSLDNCLTNWAEKHLNTAVLQTSEALVLQSGRVLTGDRVIARRDRAERLVEKFQGICVEMEGAAVAQVCHANHIPLLVLRVISDMANEHSLEDFRLNAETICKNLTELVLQIVAGYNF